MTTRSIHAIDKKLIKVHIRGQSPLICHAFSQKARQKMLDAQQGKRSMKDIRDPMTEFEESLYWIQKPDGELVNGFPAAAFKHATVGAARFYGKAIPMTQVRQFLFIHGVITEADAQALVELEGEPQMREDTVTVGQGTDLRYRGAFNDWAATLHVEYVASQLDDVAVTSLIDAGGWGVGVGDWRPQKNGDFGRYEVVGYDLIDVA